ncbi:hypothetical protein GGE65_006250 [Skermanella aerolata]
MNIMTAQLMVGDHIQNLTNKEKFRQVTHINYCRKYPLLPEISAPDEPCTGRYPGRRQAGPFPREWCR